MNIIKKMIIPFVILLIIVIYITNEDNKIYYVSLGDEISRGLNADSYSDYIDRYLKKINKEEFYTKEFSNIDKRTTDVINDIENNVFIMHNNKKTTIKKALMKSDIITLSIGTNEIFYKVNNKNIDSYLIYEYIDGLMDDINELINIIKRYCKEDIIIIGYYNPYNNDTIDNVIKYANNKLIDIANKEKIYYIDTYKLLKSTKNKINSIYPNEDDYKLISNKIIEIIEKNTLKSSKTM